MGTGAITSYIDVAQIALYAFWVFFAGLIYYLHREGKREGYPLESDRSGGRITVQGWPSVPEPKAYLLRDGRVVMSPNFSGSNQPLGGTPSVNHPGAPLEPIGDPSARARTPTAPTSPTPPPRATCASCRSAPPLASRSLTVTRTRAVCR